MLGDGLLPCCELCLKTMKNVLLVYISFTLGVFVASATMVVNGDFERKGGDKTPFAEWSYFEREKGTLTLSVADDFHAGASAIRIRHDGARDWAVVNAQRTPVKPGECYLVTAWIKHLSGKSIRIDVVGVEANGALVSWNIGTVRGPSQTNRWIKCSADFSVPENVAKAYVRIVGAEGSESLVDDVCVEQGSWPMPPPNPRIEGWAKARISEKLDRGFVALQVPTGIALSWRLLPEDAQDAAFDLYRVCAGTRTRVNGHALNQTTDFWDPITNQQVEAYVLTQEGVDRATTRVVSSKTTLPSLCIPLSVTNTTFSKIAFADLNGDGQIEFVVKTPNSSIDPAESYWKRSDTTYRLEAYTQAGKCLWTRDLGVNIEKGIWYSPYVVADVTGDQKAEVIVKIGPDAGDFRDADGRVKSGEEWVAVLDGETGKEIARAPWISRELFADEGYNKTSRNQLAVAYLDGKTPAVIVMRGTYGRMVVEALHVVGSRLERVWSFDNEALPRRFWGQGAHNCVIADVDSDGRDEICLGSLTLDDTGSVLWTTGVGHPDAHYYGDIDPARPGLELAYVIETAKPRGGGLSCVDPKNGDFIWKLAEPSTHVHSMGICSDLDVLHPGLEVYGADCEKDHQKTSRRWLLSATGAVLKKGDDVDFSFGRFTVFWDGDLQRELISGRVTDYDGGAISERVDGSVIAVGDILGDWREEMIVSVPGEIRIYLSTLPAMDRRVTLLHDAAYRMRLTHSSMGYTQVPILTYVPEACSPNINVTRQKNGSETVFRVVCVAPQKEGLAGTLTLSAPDGVRLAKKSFPVNLQPGARCTEIIAYEGRVVRGSLLVARLEREGKTALTLSVPLGYW